MTRGKGERGTVLRLYSRKKEEEGNCTLWERNELGQNEKGKGMSLSSRDTKMEIGAGCREGRRGQSTGKKHSITRPKRWKEGC